MLHPRKSLLTLSAIGLIPLLLLAEENVDLSIVNRIKAEAFENSKAMDTMFYLTDVHGPRLAGSPGYKEAGDWVVSRLKEYGLTNVQEEKWGPFGRGWASKHFEAHMIDPQYSPLIGFPLAWTAGTAGTVTGEPVMVNIQTEKDFEKYKGKLKGKIVMTQPLKEIGFVTTSLGHRYTDAELSAEAIAPEPGPAPSVPRHGPPAARPSPPTPKSAAR